MGSLSCFFLLSSFLLVSLCFLSISAVVIDPTAELIDEICHQIDNYDFCTKTFYENKKFPTTNLLGLAQITIELVLFNATNTFCYIDRLYMNERESIMKEDLFKCEEKYLSLMDNFEEAFRCLDMRQYHTMMKLEFDVSDEPRKCENLFMQQQVRMSPLRDKNEVMELLSKMVLVTATLLVFDQPS